MAYKRQLWNDLLEEVSAANSREALVNGSLHRTPTR